jgi:protein-tyrosine phosphatase
MTTQAISLTGGVNFRDLGGYLTRDGRQTKWHKLVRAGTLAELTIADEVKLADYGITVNVDLRSSAELRQYPDRMMTGTRYIHLPVLDDDETESTEISERLQQVYATNPEGGYLRMLDVYRDLVINPQAQRTYHRFLAYLAAHGQDETVLFHCSAGKDRTGMCSILLLFALGVSPEYIEADYLMTNPLSVKRVQWRVAEARQANMSPAFINSVCDLSTVKLDYYQRAMSLINEEYGGIQAYLHTVVGITDSMIGELKRAYLE